jgi:PKD repeat protein
VASLADGQRAVRLSRSGIRPIALAILVVFLLVALALPYVLYKPHPLQVSSTATPRSGHTPLTVSFFGNASGGSGPINFHWAFGDGTSSSEASPSHTYRFPGRYNATLAVSDLREGRLAPAIQINSTTTRFDFQDNLTTANPDRFVRGSLRSAFVVEGQGNVSTSCSVQVNGSVVYHGDCASFSYMYKVKRSVDTGARFDVNISVRRNATDANVSITLTGELSSPYQTNFSVRKVTEVTVRDGMLDAAGPGGVASHVAYQFDLTAGSSKTYALEIDGGLWVNISANGPITHKIEQRVTTIIRGDCRPVSVFTWVQQSDIPSLKGKVNITVTNTASNPGSVANVSIDLFGSFKVLASRTY